MAVVSVTHYICFYLYISEHEFSFSFIFALVKVEDVMFYQKSPYRLAQARVRGIRSEVAFNSIGTRCPACDVLTCL